VDGFRFRDFGNRIGTKPEEEIILLAINYELIMQGFLRILAAKANIVAQSSLSSNCCSDRYYISKFK
jgi:hypothetical protein